MTYYTFEFGETGSNTVNGVQQDSYRFKYTDAPQLILKYLRIDSLVYVGAAVSGECSGGLAFQYFNAEPPITSVAEQTFSSLSQNFNGLRFNVDKYKPFEFPEGMPLATNKEFSFGLAWFGLPPGVTVTCFMSVTMAFYVPSGEKDSGKIIPPMVVYDKMMKGNNPAVFQLVTIGGKNPTREEPTA
jgi:hypothetical protein